MSTSVDVLVRAGTSVIADVMDSIGLVPTVLDNSVVPVNFAGRAFAGPAYTISGQTEPWSGGGDRAKLAAIRVRTEGSSSMSLHLGAQLAQVVTYRGLSEGPLRPVPRAWVATQASNH